MPFREFSGWVAIAARRQRERGIADVARRAEQARRGGAE